VTVVLAVLLLLSTDAEQVEVADGGVSALSVPRSAEDEEVIQNLEVLEHLAEGQALEMMLELENERGKTDR